MILNNAHAPLAEYILIPNIRYQKSAIEKCSAKCQMLTEQNYTCVNHHRMTEGTYYGQNHNGNVKSNTMHSCIQHRGPTHVTHFTSHLTRCLAFSLSLLSGCHKGTSKRMNKAMNLPNLQNIMMEFERESEIMDLKEETNIVTRLMMSSERVTKMSWVWSVCQCTGSILTTILLLTYDCINYAEWNAR